MCKAFGTINFIYNIVIFMLKMGGVLGCDLLAGAKYRIGQLVGSS
jgi:hypothetical protein